jgi:hypothetical protein
MIRHQRKNVAGLITAKSKKYTPFESPGVYRIRVQGHISDSLADHLGGMIVTRAYTSDQEPMTILIGDMQDQSALSGVLNALYELHLPLLTVELLSQ